MAIVSLLGTLAGVVAGLEPHIMRSPFTSLPPVLLILFPGLLPGWVAAQVFGMTSGVLASGVANRAAWALLIYVWNRLAYALAARIPNWSTTLAVRLLERRR